MIAFVSRHKILLLRILGIIAFISFLCIIDWEAFYQKAKEINYTWMPAILLCVVFGVVFKAISWLYLLRQQHIAISVFLVCRIYFIGCMFAAFTPGRLGDLVKYLYLKKCDGYSFEGSAISMLVDRLLDLISLTAAAVLVVAIWNLDLKLEIIWIGSILLAAILVLFFFKKQILGILSYVENYLYSFIKNASSNRQSFSDACSNIFTLQLLNVLFWNSVSWFSFITGLYLLTIAIGFEEGGLVVGSLLVSMLLSFIPITIAGLGVRESTLWFMLKGNGITEESVLGYSLMYLFIFIVFPSLVGALFYLLEGSKMRKLKQSSLN